MAAWFPLDLVCRVFNVSRELFRRDIRPHLADACVRSGRGNRVEVQGEAAVEARFRKRLETALDEKCRACARAAAAGAVPGSAGGPPGDEFLFAGADSPALERFRTVRADQESIKLAQMRKEVIARSDLRTSLARFAAVLRRGGEVLQRQFGPDALAVWEESIAEAVRSVAELMAETEASAEVGPAEVEPPRRQDAEKAEATPGQAPEKHKEAERTRKKRLARRRAIVRSVKAKKGGRRGRNPG